MMLLNCRNKTADGMFDGRTTSFAPFEMKYIQDRIEGDHLLVKLRIYGVVEVRDPRLENEIPASTSSDGTPLINEKFKDYFTEGLTNLRLTLDRVVGNFREMNKEREAMKMSREMPSPFIVDCVKELSWIDTIMEKVNANDFALVEKYLNDQDAREADNRIKGAEQEVEQSTNGSNITGKGKFSKNGKDKPQPVGKGKGGAT